ncbi:PssD/Cps14F family polysaccharide biosynthesis glycosyltransferase [Colwelliaceae bacterium 6471]
MFKKRKDVLLLVYGKGGHNAQMKRFMNQYDSRELPCIAITSATEVDVDVMASFYCMEARDKFSRYKNIFVFFIYLFVSAVQMLRIISKYRVVGLVSTGPGLAIVPSIICRIIRAKVIYFESWSRISKPSLAGRFMYYIANIFYVQHESLQKEYPKAIYAGRL